MTFQDKSLRCQDCAATFTFSAGEQEFFAARNLQNEPKRCANCRVTMRVTRSGRDVKEVSEVACADCGVVTRVPFKPKGYRPVYCATCFASRRSQEHQEQPAAVASA